MSIPLHPNFLFNGCPDVDETLFVQSTVYTYGFLWSQPV